MRLTPFLLLFPALLAPALPSRAQTAPLPTASSLLTPALDKLRTSLGSIRIEKWKAPGPVREEANSNIGSIRRDLDGALPPLLTAADAAPGVVSRNLPVFRNVDALYDVLLRVVETADLSAPEADTEALHGALSSLEDARRSLGDALQASAVSAEQQGARLQEQLRAQQAAPKPALSTVVDDGKPGATPARKRKPLKTPAPLPQ